MRKLDYVILMLFALACIMFCALYFSKPKIAYVDLPKVYSRFELKAELEKKHENTKNQRLLILDSLKIKLQKLSKNLSLIKDRNTEDFKRGFYDFNLLKQEYQEKEQNFTENDEVQVSEYEKQIWTRINNYTKAFTKENSIDILLGADGSGTVMNMNEKFDYTEEFIKYINSNYQGNDK
jgi:Skp family chaperone for outer membrane proteins